MMKGTVERSPPLAAAYRAWRDQRAAARHEVRVSKFGFRLCGNPAMADGSFEQEEIALFARVIARADLVIDVGANIGLYTCLARHHGVPTIAIEPSADNLQLLLSNLSLNGWHDVEVLPVALADRVAIRELFGATTGASLIPQWAGASPIMRRYVPISTLDLLLGSRLAGQQVVVKIDVEGAELDVLRGATRLLGLRPRPFWIVEICLSEHHPSGINPNFRATFAEFWQRGYVAVTADEARRQVTPTDVDEWIAKGERKFGGITYLFHDPACTPWM